VDGIVIARQVEVGQRVASSFQIPTLFVIAQDLTNMQVDANVSEADIGGVVDGKESAFTVDAYPGEVFHGQVRQVRNVPISVQNVVTYDVVIGVKNPDLRLKPGMTANVSIIVAHKDNTLKVPNAALRFTPPRLAASEPGVARGSEQQFPQPAETAAKTDKSRVIWRLSATGDPEAVPAQFGISDGNSTELAAGELNEGDSVIVGIETGGARKSETLPPGFGSGQRRPGRDRGL
jgi:HlyD family secretion protein